MWATRHERHTTPNQQAAYEARPYHFRVDYNHRWAGGFGNGFLDWGQDRPVFTDADRADFIQRVALVTAANVQSQGMAFDPATLVVEITNVVPIDDDAERQ